ncbi:hypothetical protein Ptr902_03338 [Pyrenophora tritici-repentis]|nr:hypothetical protein Ptr902_03338 [Pyrenophora tritici-repentis]
MPPKRRVDDAAATPSKRARRPAASGSASQPILGKDGDAFNNDARELYDERDFIEE